MARLSCNSKNREIPFLNNKDVYFLLKHVCETINDKPTMFVFLTKRRKNIERGKVMMGCGKYDTNVSKVCDFEFLKSLLVVRSAPRLE